MLLSVTPIDDGLAVEGELDMATAPILDTAVREAAPSTGQILLDFAGVSFMDSTGLRLRSNPCKRRAETKGWSSCIRSHRSARCSISAPPAGFRAWRSGTERKAPTSPRSKRAAR